MCMIIIRLFNNDGQYSSHMLKKMPRKMKSFIYYIKRGARASRPSYTGFRRPARQESGKRSMINYNNSPHLNDIIYIISPIFLLFYHVSFAIYMTNTFNSKLVIQALDDYGVQIYQGPRCHRHQDH